MEREKQGDKIRWYCMLSFPYKPGPLENKNNLWFIVQYHQPYNLIFTLKKKLIKKTEKIEHIRNSS